MSNERTGDYSTCSNEEQKSCKHSGMASENEKQKSCESSGMPGTLHLNNTSGEELASLGLSAEVASRILGSVISLASFKRGQFHCAYSGTVVDIDPSVTSVVTSANLVISLSHSKALDSNISVYVRLPNNETTWGWVGDLNYKLNTVVVHFKTVPGFREACLDHHVQSGYNSNVVALGRDFMSGGLTYSTGIVTNKSSELYGGSLISTCKSVESGIGGPHFDFDGNFVGMNVLFEANEGAYFLSKETILKFLEPSDIPSVRINQGSDNTTGSSTGTSSEKNQSVLQNPSLSSTTDSESDPESQSEIDLKSESEMDSENESSQEVELCDFPDFGSFPKNEFTDALVDDLNRLGYPLPIALDGGMHLRHTFEEEFARDTWSKLPQKVACNMSLSVVSLASFKGGGNEERFFACTGVLIGSHKHITRILTSASLVTIAKENIIDDKLKIQVYLPNKKCSKGKLKYCDLQYNIAVVTIRGYHCRRTAKIDTKPVEPHNGVVAIGRTFETGKLMATSGMLTTQSIELDCDKLSFSTCKITKAGIGGPLIDFNGNFIGMNFYGARRTPYLPRNVILEQLMRFDGKGTVATVEPKPNRWPVPAPCWFYPSAEPRDNWPGMKKF